MKTIIFMLLLIPSLAHALLVGELGLMTSFTSTDFTETSATPGKHSGSFSPGIGFEGRFGFEFPIVTLGAIGLIDWESSLTRYQPDNKTLFSSTTYSNTRRRIAFGPTAMATLPFFNLRLVGEYFIHVQDTFTYAKPKGENPFSEKDEIKGDGYGVGIGYKMLGFYFQATYRKFVYKKGKIGGSSTADLPSSSYSKIDTSGMYLSIGVSI
ncbi:hypothetical protein M899_0503 [Bacteriovorax sp. BSW11_IV]|uniref:hypothetical protein n=1 Tax=Bacteriovorax sp. BSW11_IV TaxID=1353529 RepID=UPI00038A4C4B|nr:hypothetical protein [Bacteriovorax sp. BSW11_IV]EQC44995.1 hypothetical protein M899_0503 [Bacteriovorax sp. BSW11_IV]